MDSSDRMTSTYSLTSSGFPHAYNTAQDCIYIVLTHIEKSCAVYKCSAASCGPEMCQVNSLSSSKASTMICAQHMGCLSSSHSELD